MKIVEGYMFSNKYKLFPFPEAAINKVKAIWDDVNKNYAKFIHIYYT